MEDEVKVDLDESAATLPFRQDLVFVLPRILGTSASPFRKADPLQLVERVCSKHCTQPEIVVDILLTWFDRYNERVWIRAEHAQLVAHLTIEGLRECIDDRTVWAPAFIGPGRAEEVDLPRLFADHMEEQEVDEFCSQAIRSLTSACDRNVVTRLEGANQARTPKDSYRGRSDLETFLQIKRFNAPGHERIVHVGVANLTRLVLALRPNCLQDLIAGCDHPLVQVLAASVAFRAARSADFRCTLSYISDDAPPTLAALAILETLETVNLLDRDLRQRQLGTRHQRYRWSTNLCHPEDDLECSASELLEELSQALAGFPDPVFCRWVGEALAHGEYVLNRAPRSGRETRAEELEGYCRTALSDRLPSVEDASACLDKLCEGLSLSPRAMTNMRHLGVLADSLEQREDTLAQALWEGLLERYTAQVDTWDGEFFHVTYDRHGKQWTDSLAAAIAALSSEDYLDPNSWLDTRMSRLPVTVWDLEEDISTALNAVAVAAYICTVSAVAVRILCQSSVRANLARDFAARIDTLFWELWDTCESLEINGNHELHVALDNVLLMGLTGDGSKTEYVDGVLSERSLPSHGLKVMHDQIDEPMRTRLRALLETQFLEEGHRTSKGELEWWAGVWLELGNPELGLRACERHGAESNGREDRGMLLVELQLAVARLEERHGLGGLTTKRDDLLSWAQDLYLRAWRFGALEDEASIKSTVDESLEKIGLARLFRRFF